MLNTVLNMHFVWFQWKWLSLFQKAQNNNIWKLPRSRDFSRALKYFLQRTHIVHGISFIIETTRSLGMASRVNSGIAFLIYVYTQKILILYSSNVFSKSFELQFVWLSKDSLKIAMFSIVRRSYLGILLSSNLKLLLDGTTMFCMGILRYSFYLTHWR